MLVLLKHMRFEATVRKTISGCLSSTRNHKLTILVSHRLYREREDTASQLYEEAYRTSLFPVILC